MDKPTAKINFLNYIVKSVNFEINNDFEQLESDINMDLSFNTELHIQSEDDIAKLRLACEISKNYIEDNLPFYMYIDMVGMFTYDINMDEEELKKMLELNGTAILFPYLRATITVITNMCSISPVIIPTMNIKNILK